MTARASILQTCYALQTTCRRWALDERDTVWLSSWKLFDPPSAYRFPSPLPPLHLRSLSLSLSLSPPLPRTEIRSKWVPGPLPGPIRRGFSSWVRF